MPVKTNIRSIYLEIKGTSVNFPRITQVMFPRKQYSQSTVIFQKAINANEYQKGSPQPPPHPHVQNKVLEIPKSAVAVLLSQHPRACFLEAEANLAPLRHFFERELFVEVS